jgi:hypothetical protein
MEMENLLPLDRKNWETSSYDGNAWSLLLSESACQAEFIVTCRACDGYVCGGIDGTEFGLRNTYQLIWEVCEFYPQLSSEALQCIGEWI